MLEVRLSFKSFIRFYFQNSVATRVPLSDIIAQYVKRTSLSLSQRAYQKTANQMAIDGEIKVERHEQLWITSMLVYSPSTDVKRTTNELISMLPLNKRTPRIHTAHKIKLSIPYKGIQPLEGAIAIKPFGRYGTAKQAIFRKQGERTTIVTFKHKLNVWVHLPDGQRTEEQMINAKVTAYRALKDFEKEHDIELDGYIEKVLMSHHVVVHKQVNEAFKPIFKAYPDEIEKQIGSHICPSSHPGSIEHEGIKRPGRLVKGEDVAKGLEWLALDARSQLQSFEEVEYKYHESIRLYDEQIREHLGAIKEMRDTMKEIRDGLKKKDGGA